MQYVKVSCHHIVNKRFMLKGSCPELIKFIKIVIGDILCSFSGSSFYFGIHLDLLPLMLKKHISLLGQQSLPCLS